MCGTAGASIGQETGLPCRALRVFLRRDAEPTMRPLDLLKRYQAWLHRPAPGSKAARRRVWILSIIAVIAVLAFFFWFTSARVLTDRVEIAVAVGDDAFADSLGPLLGAEFSGGNRVQLLVNGDEFFPEMLKAIREARETITLETYIWSSGKISDQFIEALSERARAGVKVHVLGDGMGTRPLKREDRQRMIDAGVQWLVYGREHWYEIKPNINHRTHRKLLVVDGRVGFTGGMCIDDRWAGNAESVKVWRETQVRVEGPVVRQMQATFVANWLETTPQLLFGPEYFPKEDGLLLGGAFVQCYKSGPNEAQENARLSYLVAIAGARKVIQIANAYFVPDGLMVEMLVAARQRGVRVQIIVPGINDSRFGRAASRSRWGKLLAAGAEFYAYQPAMFHSKVMMVDDVFTTIGSTNFDNRSFGINDEVNINVLDTSLARRSRLIFEHDLSRSTPITLAEFENRPFYIKLTDWFCGLFRSQI
ncbi:MAG: cardiolipin synthase [Rariglobus sp.]|jgi:cardiolipin synthase|nr:cardiolipin synthase [Rariglobus sp.]